MTVQDAVLYYLCRKQMGLMGSEQGAKIDYGPFSFFSYFIIKCNTIRFYHKSSLAPLILSAYF